MKNMNTTLELPEGSKATIQGKVINGKNYLVVEVENEEQKQPEWTKFKRGDVLIYSKGKDVFAFNFNPSQSFEGYYIPVKEQGEYQVILSTDDGKFGGYGRVDTEYRYKAELGEDGRVGFMCYLPSRTGIVFKKVK